MTPAQAQALRRLIVKYGAEISLNPDHMLSKDPAVLSAVELAGLAVKAAIEEATDTGAAADALEAAAVRCDGLAMLYNLNAGYDAGYTTCARRAAKEIREMKTQPLAKPSELVNASMRIVDTSNISQVERRSDQSVLVHFPSSRCASQFEKELK